MEKFGVNSLFTPENPVCSKKGAVVINIAHLPAAMTAVMKLNETNPDFKPEGDLSLKCWFSNTQNIDIPKHLNPPLVKALAPYDKQIEGLGEQIGAIFPRQPMKRCLRRLHDGSQDTGDATAWNQRSGCVLTLSKNLVRA